MRAIATLVCLSLALSCAFACSTDEDCNLNGVCTNSACQCDYSWSGPACSSMNFYPAPPVGAYGYAPNVTAWGGIPVLVNNTYHLLNTEIVEHCGLCAWGTNSRIIHATSATLLGPYTFQNQALPVWAHNAHVVVDSSSGTPIYLLFHIGTADGGVTIKNCTAESESESEFEFGFVSAKTDHVPMDSGILHTATNPAGPWTPQNPPGLGGCNNPAPYVFPNGTIFLVCSQGDINMYTTDSWKGPWTGHQLSYTGDAGAGIWEDPFIWRDKRGNFKMLNHVYPESGTTPHFWDRVSGFAYSHDGFNWVRQPFQPYTNMVLHTTGNISYTTRERPKIFFDPADGLTPLALFNGVAMGTNCWDCKQTCGVDWTFNLAVGIAP